MGNGGGRMNIVEYFESLTGWIPTADQKKILHDSLKYRRILISAGRQSGKTVVVAVLAMWWMFKHPKPLKVLLISAQNKMVYKYMKNFFDRHPELMDEVNEKGRGDHPPAYGFSKPDGACLFVRGRTDINIRGLPADIVIIDEAASVYDDSIMVAFGNLTGEENKFLLLSTPHHWEKPYSKFAQWLQDPKKHGFKVFTWSCIGLGKTPQGEVWHSGDKLRFQRKEYTPVEHAIYVLGRLPTKQEKAESGEIIGTIVIGDRLRKTKCIVI